MNRISEETIRELMDRAMENRSRAYVPYSGFRVGACLLASSGRRYDGCNIENAAYGPTNCAERTAMFTAVCAGERDFDAIAIACTGDRPAFPCGVCRQVLAEFCDPAMPVICADKDGNSVRMSLEELLPMSFGPRDLHVDPDQGADA